MRYCILFIRACEPSCFYPCDHKANTVTLCARLPSSASSSFSSFPRMALSRRTMGDRQRLGNFLGIALACLLLASPADALPRILPRLGPCTSTIQQTLFFSDLDGLFNRTQYPPTSTVLLYMSSNVTVSDPVFLNASFSCTIFKADPALNGTMPFFYYPSNDKIVLFIINANNIIFNGIGFEHEWTYEFMPKCNGGKGPAWWVRSDGYFDASWTCSAVTVYRSYDIQITQSTILGRLDIIRSGMVELTYSYVYVDSDFWQGLNGTRSAMGFGWCWCAVRVMLSGDNVNLIRANNRIAHNYLRGGSTTMFMYWGSVGTIVQNNYITGYSFSGIQCGQMMSNVADCMLSTFELNYIVPDLDAHPLDSDGAGIYYDLHWYNPGNRDTCNYQVATSRCYYVDYCTSGLLVEGAVCIYGVPGALGIDSSNNLGGNGIKLNTGKMNVFKSVVLVNNGKGMRLGWLSCQNWCANRCGWQPWDIYQVGQKWWDTYISTYNNNLWNTNYPLLKGICTDAGYTFKGKYYSCNPNVATVPNPGSPVPYCYLNMTISNTKTGTYWSARPEISGNCSGYPTLNDYQSVFLVSNYTNTNTKSFWYNKHQFYIDGECSVAGSFVPGTNNVPINLAKGNYLKYLPFILGFNDEKNFDYGADDPSAYVYQLYPDFFSCPKRLAGPQTASFARSRQTKLASQKFNRHVPAWMTSPVDKRYKTSYSMKAYARRKKFRKAKRFVTL